MSQTFTNALLETSDYAVALLVKEEMKMNLICHDLQHYRGYLFDITTTLYRPVGINEIIMPVRRFLQGFISDKFKTANQMEFKLYSNLIKKIGGIKFMESVLKSVFQEFYDPEFVLKMDTNPDLISFRNGVVNLKDGVFRQRTKDDYFSMCLEYDYKETANKEDTEKIQRIIHNVCNDDGDLEAFVLSWFSYCLTGLTREQKFFYCYGPTASNGKTTLAQMFHKAFSIYCKKLEKKTFEEDYSKRHKQISELSYPVRFVYIEEQDRKKLDIDFLKDFIDGNNLTNEVLYGTVKSIKIQCKLTMFSNYNPNFNTDEGIRRRGFHSEFINKFVDEDDPELKNKNKGVNVYVKDKTLHEVYFATENFKIAFFHILLPYAVKYYKEGLKNVAKVQRSFHEVCDENDKMKNFIEAQFVKSTSNKDAIHKDLFLDMYREYSGLKNVSFQNILNDIKRLNHIYDKNKMIKGKRGCILGLKLKDTLDDDDEDFYGNASNDLDEYLERKKQATEQKKKVEMESKTECKKNVNIEDVDNLDNVLDDFESNMTECKGDIADVNSDFYSVIKSIFSDKKENPFVLEI
jgi:hypothetical protein